MNLNKVFIIGRLTADPQLRTTQTGQSVVALSIATNRVWTAKTGGKQEEVEYHNVVVWGKQAEIVSQFLAKGSMAFVEGRLRTRSWTDKQGQNRKTTEIICERLQLGPRSMGGRAKVGGDEKTDKAPREESQTEAPIPTINLEDEGEIKPEDLPF